MRTLGTGIRPTLQDSSPEQAPRTPAVPSTLYAAVAARNARGIPTALALPAPLAAGRCALYVAAPDGRPMWASDVTASGALVKDIKAEPARESALRTITAGTRIVAATDTAGRILALRALTRLSAPGSGGRVVQVRR